MEPTHGGDVILSMLAQGIPLTLLPDLAWPGGLEQDQPTHGRHAGDASAQDSLRTALTATASPTGRHRAAAKS